MTQPKPRPFSSLAIGDKFRLDDSRHVPMNIGVLTKTSTSTVFNNARGSDEKAWCVSSKTLVIRIHNHEPA